MDVWNSYYKHNGEHIIGPLPRHKRFGTFMLRPKMYAILLDEVKRQNIPVRYGCKVVRYFEEDDRGGVELESGEILMADVVAAADGAHSCSAKLVSRGEIEEPVSSGLSIYRCVFDAKWETRDPQFRETWEPKEGHDELRFLIGPGAHALVLLGKDIIAVLLAHTVIIGLPTIVWPTLLT